MREWFRCIAEFEPVGPYARRFFFCFAPRKILRHYAPEIGLPANFSIFDSADQTKLIKDAIKAADLSTTNFPAAQVHAAISNAKNRLESAELFARSANSFGDRQIAKIYTNYQ